MRYGLYIHIPFCRQKCFYCDFPSVAMAGGREKLMKPYVETICGEIEKWHKKIEEEKLGAPSTVYIGGGTPTALSEELLEKVLCRIGKISIEIPEFTIEANPGTVDLEKLRLLRKYGVNRLSIGVQTFDDEALKRIGRIHSGKEAVEAVELAIRAGFENISIDLIYGLPKQTMADFQKNVEKAMGLPVKHISIYGLQVEEGTVFGKLAEQGRLELPSEEVSEAMYDYLNEMLPQNGFQRYEISNYAKNGYESKHNLSYWQDIPYIGLGAGAHAYWQGQRYYNPVDIREYVSRAEKGYKLWEVEELLTEKEHMEEFCFLALRTVAGINRKRFAEVFGKSLDNVYGKVIEALIKKGLLEDNTDGVCLTKLGMKYGNQVFQEFLL